MNNVIKALAAVLIALALALALYAWTLSRRPVVPASGPGSANEQHNVVVSTRAIAAGEAIHADALHVEAMPIDPAGSFQDPGLVVGRMPVSAIGAGTPIMESQLMAGLASRVASGERAVAVRVDEQIGVGNRVRPGDFVDVFFLLRRDNAEIDRSQSRLLLSKLRVLAYGPASVDGIDPNGGTNRQEPVRTAILAVPVDRVPELMLGENTGKITLALRNPGDPATPDASLFPALAGAVDPLNRTSTTSLDPASRAMSGVALSDLAGDATNSATKKMPAPRAPGTRVAQGSNAGSNVEVIRAGKREVVSY